MHFEAGQQVGALCVEREIGRGAYGVVYLARDTLLERRVALKVLGGAAAQLSERSIEQVLTEARLLAGLNCPNIVTLYRLHTAEDGGWMQEMEFVPAGSLDDVLQDDEPLPFDRAIHVFHGVCSALRAAHAARIIHGDLKPANVLFGADDVVKLADFGLARVLRDASAKIDLEGQIFGSPHYMAPEVISGQTAGMTADVWSAGVLLYRLLTGRMPFEADTFPELFQRVAFEEPAPLDAGVPAPLAALLERCLIKSIEDRPATAAALVDELDRMAAEDVRLAPAAAARQRPTNYVRPATSFVGRDAELDEAERLIADEGARLVTVTGPGGIGKTRFAQQMCERLLDRFEGGCWFADLSDCTDADGVAHAVAAALGVKQSGEKDPSDEVAGVLQYRKPMLLVLDNFEQLLDHAMATVGLWLKRAPHVSFLVTSRALLLLGGERNFELDSLPYPPSGDEPADPEAAAGFAAVRLFSERAHDASPAFRLDQNSYRDVVLICRELDGMPLAIELAAARIRIMRPAQIARRLKSKFDLLKSDRRDLSPRQRTLTGAIDWSFELLSPAEQAAFLQTCYFRDGLSIEAAEDVLDLSGYDDAPMVMDVIQSLRDKSLLTAQDVGLETRLGMYRPILEYGVAKWRESKDESEREALARRHAAHYLEYAEEWNAYIPGPRDEEALQRVALEAGNLTVVHAWALGREDLSTAANAALAAAETLKIRGPASQLAHLVGETIEAWTGAPTRELVRLTSYRAAACQRTGDWDHALGSADKAVALARELDAKDVLAEALLEQGEIHRNRGDLEGAAAALEEAEQVAREGGDKPRLARAIGYRGLVWWQQRDIDQAYECFFEAERLGREIGDHQTEAFFVCNRGVVFESRGRHADAIACQRQAEDIARRIGNRLRVAVCLGNRANALTQSGDHEAALACYREAEAIARELGARQRIAQIVGNRGGIHSMRREVGQALACFEEAESIARELGDQRRIARTLTQRANVLARDSRHEAALAAYAEAERIGREIGDRQLVARSLCSRGGIYEELGKLEQAREHLGSGVLLYDEMHANRSTWYFTFKSQLARVVERLGAVEEAARLARECMELAGQLGLTSEHPNPEIREFLAAIRGLVSEPGSG